jgi:SAM-dependent methyltransferase
MAKTLRWLMRIRPLLPAAFFSLLRSAYWRRHWQREFLTEHPHSAEPSSVTANYAGSERAVMAEAVADCLPFSSLLEVGCGYGQLLHVLAPLFPEVELQGIDPDEERLRAGRTQLERAEIGNVRLLPGAAEDLSAFPDASVDLVLTSAALLFVPPEKIARAIEECWRVTRKSLLLLEQHCEEEHPIEIAEPFQPRYWIYNYRRLLSALDGLSWGKAGPPIIARVPAPRWTTESWQQTGHLIVLHRR